MPDAWNGISDQQPTIEILSFGKTFCETLNYVDLLELQALLPSPLTHLSLTFRQRFALLKFSHLFPRSLVILSLTLGS